MQIQLHIILVVVTIVLTLSVADVLAPLLSSKLTTSTYPLSHAQCRAVHPYYIMITVSTITTCHNILYTRVTSK